MTFFKPWRRKLGVVTLALACLFAAGWVRSLSSMDMSMFYCGRHRTELLVSFDGSLVWIRYQDEEPHNVISYPDWDTTPTMEYNYFDDPKFDWTWQRAGFGMGRVRNLATTLSILPYWSIVLPLTALSAWMLLSKPRPAKATKPDSSAG